jgi:hypothetical protein
VQAAPFVANTAGRTARTLILVGLGVQAVQVGYLSWLVLETRPTGFLGDLIETFLAVGVVWLVLVYLLAYRPVDAGQYEAARVPTLAVAVLSIFSGSIVSGLLYILAYEELGKMIDPRGPVLLRAPPAPLVTASKVCPACGRLNSSATAFCQGCGFALP